MTESIQFAGLVRPAMFWAACGYLALASSAQAVYVELADDGAYPAMSVRTETHMQQIKISIFGGGTMDFEVTKTVYEFTDGPAMLRSVTFPDPSAPIMIDGLDGTTWLTKNDAEWAPKLSTLIPVSPLISCSLGSMKDSHRAPPRSPTSRFTE